jgi:hypothetical protein
MNPSIVGHQKLIINNSDPIQTVKIKITEVWRKLPVEVLKEKKLRTNSPSFYVDKEADISIIKESKLKSSIQINKEKIMAIIGIAPGECRTLGQAMIELKGLKLNMHVVPDIIPIDADRLIEWDI